MPKPPPPKPAPDPAGSFPQRHGKRLAIHAVSLLAASAAVISLPPEAATPARQVALFLGVYAGGLNTFPLTFTRTAAHIIPILAGLGPAIGFILSGAPWQLTPLWIGLTAMLCRLIHTQGRLADVATLLPITLLALLGFGLDLAPLAAAPLPLWFAVFGLAAWLGARSLRSLDKYLLLAENPVFKDKAKRRRILDYSAAIQNLEAKITETPQDLHPHIGSIADSARAIIDLMVIEPRNFSDGDLFLARYLDPALRLIEEHNTLAADCAAADHADPNHPLARSLDILKRLDNAFKNQAAALRSHKNLNFNADLAVLDKLLKMDGS